MGLDSALDGLKTVIQAANVAANVVPRGQVGKGFPVGTELVEILANNDEEWQISLYPLPTGHIEWYPPVELANQDSVITLAASLAGNVVTLSGAVTAGVPVHIGINAGLYDVAYVAAQNDTLATIASALATAIVNLHIPGVSASAAGAAVTITGANSLYATVAASGLVLYEVGRCIQHIQATIWAPDDKVRVLLENAMLAYVGTSDAHSVALPDGTTMDCELTAPPRWSDQSSSDYSLYVSHVVFACDFPLVRALSATQIAAGMLSSPSSDGTTTITRYTFGGPA